MSFLSLLWLPIKLYHFLHLPGRGVFYKATPGRCKRTIKGIIWNSSMVRMPIRTDEVLLVNGEVEEYNGLHGYK